MTWADRAWLVRIGLRYLQVPLAIMSMAVTFLLVRCAVQIVVAP